MKHIDDRQSIEILIAVRDGCNAKTRCAAILPATNRSALIEAMLEDMIRLIGSHGELNVSIVTPSRALAFLAESQGLRVFFEERATSLSGAFEWARRQIAERSPEAPLLLLPGDLPLLSNADIDLMREQFTQYDLVLAPDAHDSGTNALMMRAGTPFRLQFGPDSFAQHRAEAISRGLALCMLRTFGLSHDIDRPNDVRLLAHCGEGRSAALAAHFLDDTHKRIPS